MLSGRSCWVGVIAWTVAVGCGSKGGALGAQPNWRKPSQFATDTNERRAKPLPSGIIRLTPKTKGAQWYNGEAPAPPDSSVLATRIVAEVGRIAGELELTPPRRDGRLEAAARDLAPIIPDNAPLAYPVIEFALQRHGVIEPSPHLIIVRGPAPDASETIKQLLDGLDRILQTGRFSRLGIAQAKRGNNDWVTVLALQASHIETKRFPRSIATNGTLTIEGRIIAPFRNPSLFVTGDNGKVSQQGLTRLPGESFRAVMSCVGRAGRQQVEITGVDASGSTVLANFPVWCGEPAPQEFTFTPSTDDLRVANSPDEAEKRLFEILNKARKQAGVGALKWDDRVAVVARSHSTEMAETGIVAHVSPRTGSASDRVRKANIHTAAIMENVARAYGIAEAHQGLLNSPGHRANALSPHATHVGIGVVLGQLVAGKREVFVTQLFIRVPPPIDIDEAQDKVRDVMHRATRLSYVGELSTVAATVAGNISRGIPSAKAAANSPVLRKRFARAVTIVSAVADISAFDPKAVLKDKRMTHYGVGVAQGHHPVLGESAIYVVLVVAHQ